MHIKRQEMPKTWPINKKGTKFLVSPLSNKRNGIPILLVLRDMLKIAENRKECKEALKMKNILVNGKEIRDEASTMLAFDTLTIKPSGKNYRLVLSEHHKFKFEEISKDQAQKKLAKVIGKRMLKGKRIQISLNDGRNFMAEKDARIGDTAIVNQRRIVGFIKIEKNAEIVFIRGKHIGETGTIESIDGDNAKIKTKDKQIITELNNIMAIEK